MNSNSTFQTTLEEIKKITGIELMLLRPGKGMTAFTCPPGREDTERAEQFAASGADFQSFGELCLVKVADRGKTELVLAGRGRGEVLTCLRLAALQISGLIRFQKDRFDRENFIKRVVLGHLLPVDVDDQAKRFRLDGRVSRTVFLIETREDGGDSDVILQILRPLYGETAGGFLFKTAHRRYVYVRTMREGETTEGLEEIGRNIVDVINTEGMQDACLSFGTPAKKLSGLSESYREACLAMRIGRIFSRESHVVAYDRLGMGRLIYSLPMPLCRKFLDEVFAFSGPDELDEEALMTIRQFFDDSLNIAETARHLYIHRNTLVYRLDKLQKQLGLNIRNFEDAMLLRLGLMVHEYVKGKAENIEGEDI